MVASRSGILDFTLVSASIFPNKLAPNVVTNIPKNPPFCSTTSFSTVSLIPYINKSASSRDLTIFMISSNSSLKNVNVVMPDAIAAFVADVASVNPIHYWYNGLKKLRNPPSWVAIFLGVTFSKIYLFSKDLITFIIFLYLIVLSIIPEPSLFVNFLLSSFISLFTKYFVAF